jgi:histidine ammonia-lyase
MEVKLLVKIKSMQDPYSFSVKFSVHGASKDAQIRTKVFMTEINSVTDNPTFCR